MQATPPTANEHTTTSEGSRHIDSRDQNTFFASLGAVLEAGREMEIKPYRFRWGGCCWRLRLNGDSGRKMVYSTRTFKLSGEQVSYPTPYFSLIARVHQFYNSTDIFLTINRWMAPLSSLSEAETHPSYGIPNKHQNREARRYKEKGKRKKEKASREESQLNTPDCTE